MPDMATKYEKFIPPLTPFKPAFAFEKTNGFTAFIPFVLQPSFMKSLIKAIYDGAETIEVPVWDTYQPIPLFINEYPNYSTVFTSKRLSRYDGNAITTWPKDLVLKGLSELRHIGEVLPRTMRSKTTGNIYKESIAVKLDRLAQNLGPKNNDPKGYIKQLTDWLNNRKKTTITLSVMDALNIVYNTIKHIWNEDIQANNLRGYDWQDLAARSRYNGGIRRRAKQTIRPKLRSYHVNSADFIVFLGALFYTKYKLPLTTFLHNQRMTLHIDNSFYHGALIYAKQRDILTNPSTGRQIPASFLESKFLFECICCKGFYNGTRKFLSPKHEGFIAEHTRNALQERITRRQTNPAKYSSDDAYRIKKPTTEPKIKLPLVLPKQHSFNDMALAASVNTYVETLHERYKNPSALLGAPRAIGGWLQNNYFDNMAIDHWKWDAEELPIPEGFRGNNHELKGGNIVLCNRCYEHLVMRYSKYSKTKIKAMDDFEEEVATRPQPRFGTPQPPRELPREEEEEERDTVMEARREALQRAWNTAPTAPIAPGTTVTITPGTLNFLANDLVATLGTPKPKAQVPSGPPKPRLPSNTPIGKGLIRDLHDNPMDGLKGFRRVKGENPTITKQPVFDLKGNLKGVVEKDTTLYLGLELEVTPSVLCTEVISDALEGRKIEDRTEANFFYNETKYLGALVANTFFKNQGTCIIKHDGSTGNGFEIVSVPGTHKWHMEEAWKGFFTEDVDEEHMKFAPSSWFCGWSNNGGVSKNPIYKLADRISQHTKPGYRPICGIHIHASRAAITPLTLGKLMYFMSADDNRPFIEQFAGRNNEKYAKVYKKPVKEGGILRDINAGMQRDVNIQAARHEALNIYTGKPTIEFRIFRANVSKSGFMKNLDFVHALITWCQTSSYSMTELTVENFVKWCNTQRGVYKYLTQWLVSHKYLSKVHEFNPKYMNAINFEDTSEDFNATTHRVA